jgi:hypothetical protein
MNRKGSKTGKLPIQPNKKQIIKKNQITIPCKGLNNVLRIKDSFNKKGNIKIQIINKAIKITPNNLFVTLRNTAYKGRKYHSGTICVGVTKELAIM